MPFMLISNLSSTVFIDQGLDYRIMESYSQVHPLQPFPPFSLAQAHQSKQIFYNFSSFLLFRLLNFPLVLFKNLISFWLSVVVRFPVIMHSRYVVEVFQDSLGVLLHIFFHSLPISQYDVAHPVLKNPWQVPQMTAYSRTACLMVCLIFF